MLGAASSSSSAARSATLDTDGWEEDDEAEKHLGDTRRRRRRRKEVGADSALAATDAEVVATANIARVTTPTDDETYGKRELHVLVVGARRLIMNVVVRVTFLMMIGALNIRHRSGLTDGSSPRPAQ